MSTLRRWVIQGYTYIWRDVLHLDRPITFVTRSWTQAFPLAFLSAFFAGGLVLGKLLGWRALLLFLAGLVIGLVLGHLYW